MIYDDIYSKINTLLRYIIHIGTNKTGTSSLQDFFYHNLESLKQKGVLYPQWGLEASAHHNLSRAVKKDPKEVLASADYKAFAAKAKGYEKILLSSESFHTIQEPSKLAEVFKPGQTEIVLYIREHAAYLSSWYQQAVQARNTSLDFEEFIDLFGNPFRILIEKWTSVFGFKNVKVRLYDRSILKNQDVIEDFLFHSLNLSSDSFEKLDHERNPSITGNLLFVKKILNNFLSRQESLSIVYELSALSKLKASFSGKMNIEDQILRKIAFRFKGDRKWLENKYGINIIAKKKSQGAVFPNYSELEDDYRLILRYSHQKNFKLVQYLKRLEFLGISGE